MQLIDIGINLMHRKFSGDRVAVVKNAETAGVSPLIITGTSERSSFEAMQYASKYPGKLYSTAGVHPHDVKNCDSSTTERLRKTAQNTCVLAIGECGLDYDRDFSPRHTQREWFEKQILLAIEMKKPLFLHERAAFDDFHAILQNYREEISNSVVHCFTGTEHELEKYLELGCYIGITGWICDERRGRNLALLVRKIPSDRLMIETDAPFLTPRDLRIKPQDGRNESKYLPHIANTIARNLNKSVQQLADETYANTKRFFML